jgi:hypothetical protein
MRQVKKRNYWLFLGFLGFISCAAGPDYKPHTAAQLNVPANWQSPLPRGAQSGDLATWWNQLNDSLLTQLIEEAVKNSPSMELARAKVREVRAQRKITSAGFYQPSQPRLGPAIRSGVVKLLLLSTRPVRCQLGNGYFWRDQARSRSG